MTLGIMQPYFLPYLGYFELIAASDAWVVFDTPQYIRHGWVNRNRVLHPEQGWQYIRVPVAKHSNRIPIHDVRIADRPGWRERMLAQLEHYRRRAPRFAAVRDLVADCLAIDTDSLAELNVHALSRVCEHLGLSFAPRRFSEMDLELGPVDRPGDWAPRIAAALHATRYVNPPGGAAIFDPQTFQRAGVELELLEHRPFPYPVDGYGFEPDLSIVDVLMWNAPEALQERWHAG